MDNNKIIIGGLALAGVGYYLYTKNKKNQTPLVNMPNKPALPTFDRDKASREFAKFAFPIIDKRQKEMFPSPQPMIGNAQKYSNASGVVSGLSREQVLANTLNDYKTSIANIRPIVITTELSLYKKMLATLNSITDDSDAEFALNEYKKIVELGERNYKPDLDTQIRFESFQKKYPNLVGLD